MSLSKYKWHKVADKETDIPWTAGAVAEVVVNNNRLCIGRFQPLAATGISALPPDAAALPVSDTSHSPAPPLEPVQLFGFAHICPHAGASMADGYIDKACNVVCPVHQLKFNLKTGRDTNGEGYKLKLYPVEVRPDGIYIGLGEGGLFKWF